MFTVASDFKKVWVRYDDATAELIPDDFMSNTLILLNLNSNNDDCDGIVLLTLYGELA